MKTIINLGAILLLALVACEKNNNNGPVVKEPEYFPLTVGSYWVYNTYKVDSTQNDELIGQNDTLEVVGDTNISGQKYMVLSGKRFSFSKNKTEFYYRDSVGYIVDNSGSIIFSSTNFSDTLLTGTIPEHGDTMLFMFAKMYKYDDFVNVPAGIFDSIFNYQLSFVDWDSPETLTLENDYLFAPNVGRVLRQWAYNQEYYQNRSYYEERLAAYHIE